MFKSYRVRAVAALSLLASVACAARAQQPTDLDKLVAPIAEAISRSGKHRICVLRLIGTDNNSMDGSVWLTQQVSTRLAGAVPGLQQIDACSVPLPSRLGPELSYPSYDLSAVKELGAKVGAEATVTGSFTRFENGIGVLLFLIKVGEKKVSVYSTGLLPFTAETQSFGQDPVVSLLTSGQIQKAGVGGVSVPKCTRCPPPTYPRDPESERTGKGQGVGTVRILLGADGRVHGTTVLKATSIGFGISAATAARRWEFDPARAPGGKAVPVLVNLELTFNQALAP
jgi:TonB family protein